MAPKALASKDRERNLIKSHGGPLICIEHELAPSWLGVRANSIQAGLERAFSSDYERACGVSNFVEMIEVRNGNALILGDMPLETLICQPTGQLPMIVRIYYADAEADIEAKVEAAQYLDFSEPAEAILFVVRSRRILVFDAAYPGNDVADYSLSFDLSPGSYSVLTKSFELDERTSLLMHKFVQVF
jgi:hypothetical protein